VILAVILKCKSAWIYCGAIILSYLVATIISEIRFEAQVKSVKPHYHKGLFDNIRVGVFILFGNLAVQMFYAIDQWFVKGTMQTSEFAYYSFAVSMMNLVNGLISAIAVTFYNFLAQKPKQETVVSVKKALIIFGTFISTAYFALVPVITFLLPKYIPSLDIVAITFSAFPYIIVINVLFVNLYKVQKKERIYLQQVLAMLGVAAVLNFIAVITVNTMQAIALATTASFVIWFYYAMKHFKFLRADVKEVIYLFFALAWFLACSHLFTWYIGGILYVLGICVVGYLVWRSFLSELYHIIRMKLW
jgi:O-antigen/teichoic acid export membrane protein